MEINVTANRLDLKKVKYRKDAKGFFNKHFSGLIPEDTMLLYKLHQISDSYQPRSFSNLKCYLAYDLECRGKNSLAEKVRKFKNPSSDSKCYPVISKKIKTLSDANKNKIIDAVTSVKSKHLSKAAIKRKRQLISAVSLAMHLGCRPGEMPSIKRINKRVFFIEGIKKDEFGGKGLDRSIEVDDESLANTLAECLENLKGVSMSKVRDNFRYLMKKNFPSLKGKLPTLYTLRHMLGSNLKASGLSREEQAYIMGHQSTRTMEHYGYRNAGKGGGLRIKPAISIDEIYSLVRDSHTNRDQRMHERFERDNRNAAESGLK